MRRSLFWLLDHYPETGESLAELQATALAHARIADELGFAGLWIAEHHFQKLGTAPNPAVLLAAIAQHTARLRLGPAVSVLPLRDPVGVAEDYALVDVLSGGRLDMGVGTGSQPREFESMGRDFEGRRHAFDAALASLLDHWRAAVGSDGAPGVLNVAPLQSPAPPIYVAVMHEESARAVGRAGHSMLTLVSPLTQDLAEVAGRLDAHARGLEEGKHAAAAPIVVAFAHIARSDDEACAVVAPALGRLIRSLVGAPPEDPVDLYEKMRARDTGLFGTPERVAKQIERYAGLGVRHMAFVTRFGGMEAAAAEKSLRRLAFPSVLAGRSSGTES